MNDMICSSWLTKSTQTILKPDFTIIKIHSTPVFHYCFHHGCIAFDCIFRSYHFGLRSNFLYHYARNYDTDHLSDERTTNIESKLTTKHPWYLDESLIHYWHGLRSPFNIDQQRCILLSEPPTFVRVAEYYFFTQRGMFKKSDKRWRMAMHVCSRKCSSYGHSNGMLAIVCLVCFMPLHRVFSCSVSSANSVRYVAKLSHFAIKRCRRHKWVRDETWRSIPTDIHGKLYE